MLKIGEFSSLAHISIRTLRHYDEVGLLRPAHVDVETGYRYYSVSQLPRLHRILALRDLGFPLDRISEALEEGYYRRCLARNAPAPPNRAGRSDSGRDGEA